MKRQLCAAFCICFFAVSGCANFNVQKGVSSGVNLLRAASVSDSEIKDMSRQMRASDDAKATVAAPNSEYAQRLARVTEKLQSVNGVPLNYKVYMTNEMNANATPDGSVRVYSGLMD